MINWLKKTATDVTTITKNALNTPAPIGKTVAGVLIVEGLVIGSFLVANTKIKVTTILVRLV